MADRDDGAAAGIDTVQMRTRVAHLVHRIKALLLWRVWERMVEIEFIDRSVALAGKAFVSFFPLVIVVAAFVPERLRSSIITAVTTRLGIHGEALQLAREAFASSDDVRKATGLLGLVLTVFYASSFTTALQRVYLRAWRRPLQGRVGARWRGAVWLLLVLATMAVLGGLHARLGSGWGIGLVAIASLCVMSALWWFTAWLLLLGQVRPRVLLPTAVLTGVGLAAFALSATIWMPNVVTHNEEQFGLFGIALALVTWFSGAATVVVVGACAGPVLADDPGWIGSSIRGHEASTLIAGAPPPLVPPRREPRFGDAFHSEDET